MRFLLLPVVFLSGSLFLAAQSIFLDNASFEGKPQDATVPLRWFPCEPGTTPDILPGPWGVYQEAAHGDTYVGLITRDDGTWESITQRLRETLAEGECFVFKADLAHSDTYSGYNNPIKLRIWGGAAKCGKDQLLLETDLVRHLEWKTYEVQFYAKKPINYLLFEAFYSDRPFSHRGNILIDNLTAIKKCPRA